MGRASRRHGETHLPAAILLLPSLVNRRPPNNSSMYPSSINRFLCSTGMRCITLWRRLATRRILRGSMEAHPDPGPFSKYAPTACVFKPKSAAGVEFGTAARLPLPTSIQLLRNGQKSEVPTWVSRVLGHIRLAGTSRNAGQPLSGIACAMISEDSAPF